MLESRRTSLAEASRHYRAAWEENRKTVSRNFGYGLEPPKIMAELGGKPVEVGARFRDGADGMQVQLADRRYVPLSELKFKDATVKTVYDAAGRYDALGAQAFLDNYTPNIPFADYVDLFDRNYKAGLSGRYADAVRPLNAMEAQSMSRNRTYVQANAGRDASIEGTHFRNAGDIDAQTPGGYDAPRVIESGTTSPDGTPLRSGQEQKAGMITEPEMPVAIGEDSPSNAGNDLNSGGGESIINRVNQPINKSGTAAKDSLLARTTCTTDELGKYLAKIAGADAADTYRRSGVWPKEVQIPKSGAVLTADGGIDWRKAPKGGYVLDQNGNPVLESYIPKRGEIIDRYGPSDGRYTCPVIDGKPFSYDQRTLPFVEDPDQYHKYRVIGDFANLKDYIDKCNDSFIKDEIIGNINAYYEGDFNKLIPYKGEISKIDGWGVGGGIQYELPLKIKWLEKLGLIKEIFD